MLKIFASILYCKCTYASLEKYLFLKREFYFGIYTSITNIPAKFNLKKIIKIYLKFIPFFDFIKVQNYFYWKVKYVGGDIKCRSTNLYFVMHQLSNIIAWVQPFNEICYIWLMSNIGLSTAWNVIKLCVMILRYRYA